MSATVEDGVAVEQQQQQQQRARRFPQLGAVLFATLSVCSIGTYLSWTSPALSLYKEDGTLPIDNQQGSWISALFPIGAIIGTLPAGLVADIFGRRSAIWFMTFPLFFCWFIIAFNDDVVCVYCARLLAGVASGALIVVVPTYVAEIGEPRDALNLGVLLQLQMAIGIVNAYAAGLTGNLLSIAMLCAVIPGFLLIAFPFMPESPAWLVGRNRRKEADYSIRRLRGRHYRTETILASLEASRKEPGADRIDLATLRNHRRPVIIALGLACFQQLSGVYALVFYVQEIFEKTGSPFPPTESSVIVGILHVIAAYFASMPIERCGRKILLFVSASLMAVCMFLLSGYFRFQGTYDVSRFAWVPLLAVAGFHASYSFGFGPLPSAMLAELCPHVATPTVRVLAGVCHWTVALLVTAGHRDALRLVGPSTTFAGHGMLCLAAMLFVAVLVPETRGKSHEQIRAELYGADRDDTRSLKSVT